MNNDFEVISNFRNLRCPQCGRRGMQKDRLQVAYISPNKTKNGYLTKMLCPKCSIVFDIWQKPTSETYPYLSTPKGRMPEHWWVWGQVNGDIPPNHVMHHLNGIKTDNRLENLAAIPRAQHLGNNSEGHVWILVKELQKRIRELESELNK